MKKILFAAFLSALLVTHLATSFHSAKTESLSSAVAPNEVVRSGIQFVQSQENLGLDDQQPPGKPQRRPGHLLVRFKSSANASEVTRLKANRVVDENSALRVTHLKVSTEEELGVFEQLKGSPAVEFVEFDSIVTTQWVPNDPYYATPYPSSKFGNIAQWGVPAISAPSAWDMTLGDPSTVIAIVDTGVDNSHPDLASKIVGEYSPIGKVKDGFGHGTHCAGIAAAVTNDGNGVAGMCPACKILSVKVLDDNGSGYISDVASGIVYAADHGADVISLSLGGSGRSETLHAALEYAITHNALPVCAMGNSGTSLDTPEPAYWFNCLSVVATDNTGARASFSNYGNRADIAAPGVGILSTMPTYSSYLSTHGYKTNYDALSGTSMATPMVAGLAGLVRSRNPNLTPAQVRGIIMATAGDGKSWSPALGFGLVNAARAVEAAINSDFAPPTVNLLSPAQGATISKLVNVQAAPTDNGVVHHVDIIRDGTRMLPPLTGVSTTSGSGKNGVTTPAWTISWPSTLVFNGLVSATAFATDSFGNMSTPQSVNFTIQNQLISQSWIAHVCSPSTPGCSNFTSWLPVTTPIQTEAATHLQGNVTYSTQCRYPTFQIQVTNSTKTYYCVTNGTTIDCYPSVTLLPSASRQGSSSSNYVAGKIDCGGTRKSGNAEADINITLTYPQ